MNALSMTPIKIIPAYLLAGQMLPQHHSDMLITESTSNYGCFYLSLFFPPTPERVIKIPLHHATGVVCCMSS